MWRQAVDPETRLDDIEVHDRQVVEPRRGHSDGNVEANAAGAYDQHSSSSEIGLALVSPGAHGPFLPVRGLWGGQRSSFHDTASRSPMTRTLVACVQLMSRPSPRSQLNRRLGFPGGSGVPRVSRGRLTDKGAPSQGHEPPWVLRRRVKPGEVQPTFRSARGPCGGP